MTTHTPRSLPLDTQQLEVPLNTHRLARHQHSLTNHPTFEDQTAADSRGDCWLDQCSRSLGSIADFEDEENSEFPVELSVVRLLKLAA